MPTYVYKFVDTGETIEVQQSFTDDALTEATHPQTGAVLPVKKVFTPVGVTFRGNGFYKTDSRGKSKSSSGSAGSGGSESSSGDSASTPSNGSSSDSKSETKSSGTTESKSGAKDSTSSSSKPAPTSPSTSS